MYIIDKYCSINIQVVDHIASLCERMTDAKYSIYTSLAGSPSLSMKGPGVLLNENEDYSGVVSSYSNPFI